MERLPNLYAYNNAYLQRCEMKDNCVWSLSFLGEASASTMWDNNAWIFFYDNSADGDPPFLIQDFIHTFQPNAKLIVMLRDPVERLATNISVIFNKHLH